MDIVCELCERYRVKRWILYVNCARDIGSRDGYCMCTASDVGSRDGYRLGKSMYFTINSRNQLKILAV